VCQLHSTIFPLVFKSNSQNGTRPVLHAAITGMLRLPSGNGRFSSWIVRTHLFDAGIGFFVFAMQRVVADERLAVK
jgi:hypothetical protein